MYFGTICFLFLPLFVSSFPFDQFDFANLGQSISNSVANSLKPLGNLGAQIESQVQSNLAGLENLGSMINERVQQSLLPVTAMGLKAQMMNGIGGKTIKQFPDGTNIVVENGISYKCIGNLNVQNGNCDGSLAALDLNDQKNYCFITPNVRVNDYLCFSSNSGGLSVQSYNGHVSCKSNDNSPVLMITRQDFDKMCGFKGGIPTYTYFADVNNPLHVQIPNANPYVACVNNTPNICTFS